MRIGWHEIIWRTMASNTPYQTPGNERERIRSFYLAIKGVEYEEVNYEKPEVIIQKIETLKIKIQKSLKDLKNAIEVILFLTFGFMIFLLYIIVSFLIMTYKSGTNSKSH